MTLIVVTLDSGPEGGGEGVVLMMAYCWFSHDVTKIQTTKLSILLRFYFHDVFEQLKLISYIFSLQKGSWFCDRVRLNF